jgi:hypothetical protein
VSNKDLLADSETENSKLEKKKNEGERERKRVSHTKCYSGLRINNCVQFFFNLAKCEILGSVQNRKYVSHAVQKYTHSCIILESYNFGLCTQHVQSKPNYAYEKRSDFSFS